MIVANKIGLSGRFKLEAVNAETGSKRVLADWFENLITNAGLDQLALGAVGTRCLVGSGSTPPTVNDSGLQTTVASTTNAQASSSNANLSTPPYYHTGVTTFRFAQGAAAGNLSEVAITASTSTTPTWIFSRALIKDVNGNPTTVTVLASEFLDVSYELRIYPPMNDVTVTRTIAGVNYEVLMRAADIDNGSYWSSLVTLSGMFGNDGLLPNGGMGIVAYTGNIGTLFTVPATAISGNSRTSSGYLSYTPGSYKRGMTITLGLNDDNAAGGIKSMHLQRNTSFGVGSYQFQFTPNIPKNNTNILTLTFEVSWARRP